jgi:glycine cleavage system regulatory protein
MKTALVLTVIADDRPGLVEALAQTLAAQGGNWLESRMARLAGKFAGIVLAEIPRDGVEDTIAALEALSEEGLRIQIERSDPETAVLEPRLLRLDLVGQDRPGIVRAISHALTAAGVNVDRLHTERTSAPMSGEPLFRATADLRLPVGLETAALRRQLEAIAQDLMVDLRLLEPQS